MTYLDATPSCLRWTVAQSRVGGWGTIKFILIVGFCAQQRRAVHCCYLSFFASLFLKFVVAGYTRFPVIDACVIDAFARRS